MPDVWNKAGEVPKAGKLHPGDKTAEDGQAENTPEKHPEQRQSDSETEVDVTGSQTPRKKGRKRSADSNTKTDKCESDEETKSDPKKKK